MKLKIFIFIFLILYLPIEEAAINYRLFKKIKEQESVEISHIYPTFDPTIVELEKIWLAKTVQEN
jgi:hypothetical protein